MASLNKIKVGQILYDTVKRKMGNTNMLSVSIVFVTVIEINLDTQKVLVRWGNNPERWVNSKRLSKYKVKRPELEEQLSGAFSLKRK